MVKKENLLIILSLIFILGCHSTPNLERSSTLENTKNLILEQERFEFKSVNKAEASLDNSLYIPLHYEVYLNLLNQNKSFSGILNLKIKRLKLGPPLTLHMSPGLVLNGLSIDGSPFEDYKRVDDKLIINTMMAPQTDFTVTLSYSSSQPLAGIYFYEENRSVKQIWTRGEPEESRSWIPSFDSPEFKAPIDLFVTVPSSWQVLSNGVLTDIREDNKISHTFHWKETIPLPTYLYSVLAGELMTTPNKTLTYWAPQSEMDKAVLGFNLTPEVLNFYSTTLIPYPFKKLAIGIAYDFLGAMEHASNITFSQNSGSDKNGFDIKVATHEIAHQWFGDIVTCKDWDHLWLNEGFANYFEVLFWQQYSGQEEFLYRMESYKTRYISSDMKGGKNGLVGPVVNYQTLPTQKFGVASYEKGALVLNTLRYYLGDKDFFEGLKYYLNKYKFESVTTDQLKTALEEFSHKNLTTFFDQWLYRAGQPEFFYTWTWDPQLKKVQFNLEQIQDPSIGLYETPIDIYLNGQFLKIDVKAQKLNTFDIIVEQKPEFIILDPNHSVLSKVTSQKTTEEWFKILEQGPTILAQGDALGALGKNIDNAYLEKLISENKTKYLNYFIYKNLQSFDLTAEQLRGYVKAGLSSSSEHVRMVSADLAGKIFDLTLEDQLLEIYNYDTHAYASMYAAFSLAAMNSKKASAAFLAEINRVPRRNYMILAAAISALGINKEGSATDRLMELFEGPFVSAHFMRAITAQALADMGESKATLMIAKELIIEQQPDLSLSYIRALTKMGDRRALPFLQEISSDSNRPDPVRKAAMDAIQSLGS